CSFHPPPNLPRKGGGAHRGCCSTISSHTEATPSPLRGGLGRGETKQGATVCARSLTALPPSRRAIAMGPDSSPCRHRRQHSKIGLVELVERLHHQAGEDRLALV